VDRERTLSFRDTLTEIFGDILPVRVGNYDNWFADMGFNPFCGNNLLPQTTSKIKTPIPISS